ncbi:unnamed protein product [Ceutorhynchus assimilis]|uniref:Uncharacterized protein n=1 Tax=Ceutorhynchus assimilis TaxID=467358 RepID=A0A9N9MQR5_9CUCU|nr:unnamed protein product [Ceutorhynchus assimilis]
MDQPIYLKVREIVASCCDDPILGKVEMIIGGFHMLISYLGCIGQTMAGSGLKELLSCALALNSIDKMLIGKSYSRAVRGHLLVQATLAQITLENIDITPEEKEQVVQRLQTSVEITP